VKHSKDELFHINETWAFGGDEHCLTLYQRKVTKKGKVWWDVKGYYTDYRHMLKRLAEMEVWPLTSLNAIIYRLDKLEKTIEIFHQRVSSGLLLPGAYQSKGGK
jgi:hypothetical protein